MEHPYRENPEAVPARQNTQGVEPLSPGEMELWDKVYAAVAGCNDCKSQDVPSAWADKAVQKRRERFGVR